MENSGHVGEEERDGCNGVLLFEKKCYWIWVSNQTRIRPVNNLTRPDH